jgi:hypothetical protein
MAARQAWSIATSLLASTPSKSTPTRRNTKELFGDTFHLIWRQACDGTWCARGASIAAYDFVARYFFTR